MSRELTSIVWGDVAAPVTFEFRAPGDCGLYGYGTEYCLNGCEHTGIDIGVPFGTTLYAVADGEITCAGTDVGAGTENTGCAKYFCIDSLGGICGAGRVELWLDDGTTLIYGHCSAALVDPGQRVSRGDPIARSGEQNGPHVHLEYRQHGDCASGWIIVNPETLLTETPPEIPTFTVGDTLAVDASDGLNLRTGPGLSYSLITTMPLNRKGIVVSGPTIANGLHWYEIETRHGRGYAAAGEYMKRVTLPNYTENPTANSNLNYIVPNRQATTLQRVYLDSNWRVKVTNPGSGTMEGVRYESLHGMGWTGQQYFGGILHQLKGTNGQVLDYVRVSIYYTDGTGTHSSPYSVTMDGDWHHVIPFHVASNPAKTIDWVTIKAIRNNPQAMTFYTDNAWVVEL